MGAVRFLNGEISELCLGKPELTCISSDTAVTEAATALKASPSGDCHVSVWTCSNDGQRARACVGKVSMADVILFLCREENRADPLKAYVEARAADLLPKGTKTTVRHLDTNSRLSEAIDAIIEGPQNLIIPIQENSNKKKYCSLAQEDIVRFILNSIASFSPIPTSAVDSLNLIDRSIPAVHYDEPATSALKHLERASAVAVVDGEDRLIGEISISALSSFDETLSSLIMGLSVGELLSLMDHGPTEDSTRLVRKRLREKNLIGMLELIDELGGRGLMNSSSSSLSSLGSCCSSSDDEGWSKATAKEAGGGSGRVGNRPGRRFEVVVCGRKSSLVAVMIQALAHRVSCVWVVDGDRRLVGAVTFAGILKLAVDDFFLPTNSVCSYRCRTRIEDPIERWVLNFWG